MRNTWKIGSVIAVVALSLSSAVPAFAAAGTGKNIGTAYGISGVIPDGVVQGSWYNDIMVNYTCGSVHETQNVWGIVAQTGQPGLGLQDSQSCQLAPGSPLPKKVTTYTPGDYWHLSWYKDGYPFFWLSDYQYATSGINTVLLFADNVTYTITPSGAVKIVSFYANIHDTCEWIYSASTDVWSDPYGCN